MTRTAIAALASCGLLLATAGGVRAERANPASDAPESRPPVMERVEAVHSYPEALQRWRSAEDINGWIGAKFDYDMPRALRLSETQRNGAGPIAIHSPETFFGAPLGVCVDLARFAVETLRAVDPGAKPAYLMIEFAPVTIAGNTLRRHWLASFERGGQRYFFADSKRPGVLSGPYASTQEFLQEYARYRGREVVSFREVESYERKERSLAARPKGSPHAPGLQAIVHDANPAANRVEISPRLVTSGQPDADALGRLKAQGFEAVIYLAPASVPDAVRDEQLILTRQGITFINIPVRFDSPTEGDFETFAAVLGALGDRKVLVHCQVNMRASAMVFLYRAIKLREEPRKAYEAVTRVWAPEGPWKRLIEQQLRKHKVSFELL